MEKTWSFADLSPDAHPFSADGLTVEEIEASFRGAAKKMRPLAFWPNAAAPMPAAWHSF